MHKENQKREKETIVILGAGGFAREVVTWLNTKMNIVFFSEDSEIQSVKGFPMAVNLSHLRGCKFLAAVGDPKLRERLWNLAIANGLYCDGVLFSDDSTIGEDVNFNEGALVCPGVRISTDITIGKSVILNLNATVGHDCVIEDFVTISPGALISGGCHIGKGAYIGTGASIREKIKIGAGAVVGMGAAVIKDIPAGEIWGGVPAKRIK